NRHVAEAHEPALVRARRHHRDKLRYVAGGVAVGKMVGPEMERRAMAGVHKDAPGPGTLEGAVFFGEMAAGRNVRSRRWLALGAWIKVNLPHHQDGCVDQIAWSEILLAAKRRRPLEKSLRARSQPTHSKEPRFELALVELRFIKCSHWEHFLWPPATCTR